METEIKLSIEIKNGDGREDRDGKGKHFYVQF